MAEALRKEITIYTYSDYSSWSDNKRWEIINGKAYSMAPSPSEEHQDASGELFYQFKHYLKGKSCKVYHAPFDLVLPDEGETFNNATNTVQPDIMIVCDKNKRQKRYICGPPDIVIEIISPSSRKMDMKDKFSLYEKHGVPQYWLVDLEAKLVMIFKLGKNNEYGKPEIYAMEDKINVDKFEGLTIDLVDLFPEE